MQMSKGFGSIAAVAGGLFLILVLPLDLRAQTYSVSIKVGVDSPATIEVAGKLVGNAATRDPLHLSFRTDVFAPVKLADRYSDVKGFDAAGQPVPLKKLIDGEYLAESNISGWAYKIDLTPSRSRGAAAHTSWIAGDRGLLMIEDILPLAALGKEAVVSLAIENPDAWRSLPLRGIAFRQGSYLLTDPQNAVIALGKGWRDEASSAEVDIAIHGEWHFTDPEVSEMVREIISEYSRRFGNSPLGMPQIFISKFPQNVSHGVWEAETRGRNVTIISSDMPFRTQSLQRLHEQLRHELFHLWIPNGVNLTGNYDWFYEGFALYESLKLAVSLNRIRFEDFLDTLSRAHTIDGAQSQRISLITASNTRFAGSNTQVYSRGMLVAFLCDLALLDETKGKRSVENVLEQLFEKHRKPAEAMDGNAAVLSLLRANPQVVPVVDRYVTGTDKMEWTDNLARAGIEDSDSGPLTTLRVKEKLNGRQKALLDKLGYNNWQKLTVTSK
ncbi:MAG: hypothetical protein ABI857_09605 [Acidobacteriota bacterium]